VGEAMKAVAVKVNGKQCCKAGIAGLNCITVEISLLTELQKGDEFLLRVHGVNISGGELLEWPIPALKLTDRIEFEVIETITVDTPSKRSVVDKRK
jgi:hypothetical protein